MPTYLVHAGNEWKVGIGVLFRLDKDRITLRRCEVYHTGLGLLGVNSIHLDDLHRVTLEPQVGIRKGADIDDAKEVRFPRLQADPQISRLIQQRRIRHRLRSGGIFNVKEPRYQRPHLLMVPI